MDLSAEVETGTALSLPSTDRFSASYQGWEARAAVSSAPFEAHTLQLSDSEELDAANARDTEDSPPQSRAYEKLVEVVTRAVEKLCTDWPAEREDKLDERFLPSRAQPQRRGLPFFPDLHTEVWHHLAVRHRDVVLAHMKELGLRLNTKKSTCHWHV